ncbi:MAG: hypothetical protein OXC01_21600 [Immundisolibacterales bacterium]|nr:hypothetical protein [Immundisolibacterales bacterium]
MVRRIPGACERDDRHRRSPDGGRDRSSLLATRPRLSFLFLLLSLLASPVAPANDTVARSLCDTPPHEEVCPVAPKDNTDFDASFIYLNLEKNAQDPFDIFSWQTFVALNWPANEAGAPLGEPIGTHPNRPRVWQSYGQPGELFGFAPEDEPCRSGAAEEVATGQILQFNGKPLIDRDLNYIVFDTRLNGHIERYVVANGLDSAEGQRRFREAGKAVDFPRGHYEEKLARTGGALGSIAIKTSWKIMDADASGEAVRYYTVDGRIAVPAARSETGEALCVKTRLALLGMHIMHRTESGNGGDWIWSTFEHVDVAPIADNSLDPNNILGELFTGGCRAESVESQRYVLFNPDCKDCATNAISPAEWKWFEDAPHARGHATRGEFGTQVVRCWKIFESTARVNEVWHARLRDTVWSNYRLISTQWRGAPGSRLFPNGEVPRFLTNVTLETYDQFSHGGTCMGCHAKAVTAAGQNANFSFLLSKAR